MSIVELMPLVESLPRAEKLKLMQFLLSCFAQDEGVILELPDDQRQDSLWSMIGMAEGTESDTAKRHDEYLYGATQ
jgi:hypothetical protein